MLYVMLRCGLFAYVVGAAVASVLVLFPITADFSAWYAGSAHLRAGVHCGVTGYAFHTALGGRPLFKTGVPGGVIQVSVVWPENRVSGQVRKSHLFGVNAVNEARHVHGRPVGVLRLEVDRELFGGIIRCDTLLL